MMRIAAAAVRTKDGKVWTLPQPARHANIMMHIYEDTGNRILGADQGFVTECGRFLSRKQSLVVVRKSGQLTDDIIGGVLTSEDLW